MRHRILLFAIAILLAATVSSPVSAAAEDSRALAASPVLVSPVNNAILRNKRPAFDWGNFPRATNYQIQVSRVRTFSSLLLNKQTASSRYVPSADLPGKTILYWRVRARIGASFSTWSSVWKFTTGNPPSIPILLTPANNARLDDSTPLFDWRNSSVPTGVTFGRYQIQVAADTTFRNILHNKNIAGIANSQDDSAVLAACSTCYWRVRAFSANGDFSAWSPVRSFTFSIVRPLPDTWDGIHVFNDQLWLYSNPAWIDFSATHYAGTQKMTRSDADALRAVNPNFVILNYRLGMGLGYQGVDSWETCNFTGDWLAVIEGNDWVREWPGEASVQENWFYHWPEGSGNRVINCDWGWYLMDPANPGWRSYWAGEVLRQLQANDADGLFADSFSVPNFLGYNHYDPDLPEVNAAFEADWTARLEDFMAFAQSGDLAAYHFIPNAGMLVTSRETTDYSLADGVMVEGFGEWGGGGYFDPADWELQLNNILDLINRDKAVIAQQYVDAANVNDRMFLLSNYLLIKGRHTYINLDYSMEPEWFPEYEIPIGNPTGSAPVSIANLWNAGWGVYARTYSNGLVLVNPGAVARTVNLGQTYYRAIPTGGGIVPDNGNTSAWIVTYTAVTQVTLSANRAAILLVATP